MTTTSTGQISYTLKIDGLATKEDPQLGLVVTNVYWQYYGCVLQEAGKPNVWDSCQAGCITLPDPSPVKFTDFNQLTKDEVIQWALDLIGIDAIIEMQMMISKTIDAQRDVWQNKPQWQSLPWTE